MIMEQTIQAGTPARGSRRKRGLTILAAALAVAGIVAAVLFFRPARSITLSGVVLKQDGDPRKQVPISGVVITAANVNGTVIASAISDSSGGFHLTLGRWFTLGKPLELSFRHSDYQLMRLNESAAENIYVVRMLPTARADAAESNPNATRVANVLLRYTINDTTNVNVGSMAQAFEVVNNGNVPCNRRSSSSAGTALAAVEQRCSPDGKWKAASGSFSLDAGVGNKLRDVRVACIAGPCPFTRIEQNSSSQKGRILQVSALDWSDTATFLVEAEVFHPMVSDVVRNSHPVVFGRVLSFTLPADAEGPSLEAEIGGTDIIFPLGPKLTLSWTTCAASVDGRNRSYHCELKPGYRF
jgi:hypothetical protein